MLLGIVVRVVVELQALVWSCCFLVVVGKAVQGLVGVVVSGQLPLQASAWQAECRAHSTQVSVPLAPDGAGSGL